VPISDDQHHDRHAECHAEAEGGAEHMTFSDRAAHHDADAEQRSGVGDFATAGFIIRNCLGRL
jgi:hypothetical protein